MLFQKNMIKMYLVNILGILYLLQFDILTFVRSNSSQIHIYQFIPDFSGTLQCLEVYLHVFRIFWRSIVSRNWYILRRQLYSSRSFFNNYFDFISIFFSFLFSVWFETLSHELWIRNKNFRLKLTEIWNVLDLKLTVVFDLLSTVVV